LFAGFLLNLFLRPWRWRRYVSPEHRLTLNRLHGVISQKIYSSMNILNHDNHFSAALRTRCPRTELGWVRIDLLYTMLVRLELRHTLQLWYWGYRSGEGSDCGPMGYYIASSCTWMSTFRKKLLSPSPDSKYNKLMNK
jgi:hypothetical protein